LVACQREAFGQARIVPQSFAPACYAL